MKKLKIATILILFMCFFFNVAIRAMDDGENRINQKIDGVFKEDVGKKKREFVRPEKYHEFFRKRFGFRKGYYCKSVMEGFLKEYEVKNGIFSSPSRLINAKDYIDKYLNEYLDYLISILDNDLDNFEGSIKDFGLNRLYMNIMKFPDDLKEKYKNFTKIYENNEEYYDYIMEKYIDHILSIKNHFTVKELSENEENEIVMEGLEDRILKEKLEKIYEKLKAKLIGANIRIEQGLENSYEYLMDVIEESIKFDEDLQEEYKLKNKNNIDKMFENLFKSRKAIVDFIGVVNFEINLLRQVRVINPELVDEEKRLNDRSDFINFIP